MNRISSIERVVVVPYGGGQPVLSAIPRAATWAEFIGENAEPPELTFERLPFDHPLYILYSSGTTGLPKCMVHGGGGTLLQHLKEHGLHTDIKRDDRVFYFTTCGWMMWNWLVSSLALGSTIVLYDGAPFSPAHESLWDMAEQERITVFGTSAKVSRDVREARPRSTRDARSVVASSNSFHRAARSRITASTTCTRRSNQTCTWRASAAGRTSCRASPAEIQSRRCIAASSRRARWEWRCMSSTKTGKPVICEPGELVCTRPFVSMPVAFWNDPDGAKYRAAYFEQYPNVWRHGDWCELTEHDGMIIYGRSDATLNPGGVRIGTAEIYRQVEQLPEIVESVAIGQEIADDATGDVRIVLFVRLREGVELDEPLRERIRTQIRSNTSPLHVPKKIIQVTDIPRTISGKISELAVRDVVHGRPVKNTEALANPESLELYDSSSVQDELRV